MSVMTGVDPVTVGLAVVGGTGIACGAALAVAARFLSVKEDPRIEKATEILPGANCGGCGYAGCADYAKAIVLNGVAINLCSAAGEEVLALLSEMMGVSATAAEKRVAIVLCGGDTEKAVRRFKYNGIADCRAAHAVGGGDKGCSYGCLGYGSCSRVCPTGAIEITGTQLAVVHPVLCIACGACVKACPRSLIKIVPVSRTIHVLCRSKDKGPIVKKLCKVGCIGCTVCAKNCDEGAIVMEGTLAVVDYARPLTTDVVIEKCPTNCIVRTETEVSDKS
jgi:Na+-translocating ferredoxin:NAD+ oxidoreductase RNF subunit RnfB